MKDHALQEPKAALDAARTPGTTAAELRLLAQTPWAFVWAAVARHPNTEPDVLLQLTPTDLGAPYGGQTELAIALASNPSTPLEALSQLVTLAIPLLNNPRDYPDVFELGVTLCTNPVTPFASIQQLLTADTARTEFRKVVARETRRPDAVDLLLRDRSERVRQVAERTQALLAAL